MYQWVNPQTGRTHLSGKPPAWYRADRPGPRVFVFENGRLVDDTSRAVSLEEQASLRATAVAVQTEPAAPGAPGDIRLPPIEAGAEAGAATRPEQGSVLERGFGAVEDPTAPASTEPPDATIARLKSIIDAWEQQQTDDARRVLEQSAVVPPTAQGGDAATRPPNAPALPAPAAPGTPPPPTPGP